MIAVAGPAMAQGVRGGFDVTPPLLRTPPVLGLKELIPAPIRLIRWDVHEMTPYLSWGAAVGGVGGFVRAIVYVVHLARKIRSGDRLVGLE